MTDSIWIEPGAALNPALPLSKNEMKPLIRRLLSVLGLQGASLELRLVDDVEIARLNREFLGMTGPTNVLSFPAEDPEQPQYLGELALSVDTLTREAALYGQDPQSHLVRLLAHGLLHLAGYDHGQAMEAMTDAAVEALG
ncbi:rRNA maturation RNase YbeY [Fundidesulfovibrio putealis]|uniref:rRNA maturation RNase YbeY n=1 Tax=Fundidesulfovibrio putealis TaxID=270496 RepID=UPI00041DF42D|nr:rRNA maturation RNase YbeY [Fundidesulfovibrio putealis]